MTGLKFLYKAAAAGAPPDAIAPANRSGSSSLQHKEDGRCKHKRIQFLFKSKISFPYLRKMIAADELNGIPFG
jgi:hypothetical protein